MLFNSKIIFIAKKYADAIYFLAIEKKKVEIWEKYLLHIINICIENVKNINLENIKNRKFFTFMLKEISNYLDKELYKFLLLLIQYKRYNLIIEIYKEFLKCKTTINYTIIISKPISKECLENLKNNIKKKNKNITNFNLIYDKNLLGGIIIKQNNVIIDNSIKNSLNKIKKTITEK